MINIMSKVKLNDLTVFVIHLIRETSREPIIKKLKKTFPDLKVFPAIDKKDLSWNKWKNLKKFHRLPTHQNREVIMGEVALSLTNLKLLKYIVKNKLNNVLVLEDDAIINTNKGTFPKYLKLSRDIALYYLGGHVWNSKLWGTYAIIYPNWNITREVLEELINPKRFRAWDSMMVNYIHKTHLVKGFWDYRDKTENLEHVKWSKSLIIPDLNLTSILRGTN